MNNHYLIALTFLAGLVGGWLGKTWVQTLQMEVNSVLTAVVEGNQTSDSSTNSVSNDTNQAWPYVFSQSSLEKAASQDSRDGFVNTELQSLEESSTDISPVVGIDDLLTDRQYFRAITLLQEQTQTNEQNAARLRLRVLEELGFLIEAGNNSDFSDLVENYLSVYYDDIDALLLLAEFNKVNGSYLEVVNVFLLAKTYAYSVSDQSEVAQQFNNFVLQIDDSYTNQTDWASLINLYGHINTSGLMTSTYQYRQAIAYLRNGDEAFAIEQLNQLLTDSLVGESAAKALSGLVDEPEAPTIVYNSLWEGADSIALQKLGNQYAVNLDNARRESVKLLIDTGASMTAVSRESFETLNANGDAVQQDNRIFRTASGLVQATVYSVPELVLGPHRLENTQIAVIDFGTERGIDGLLGMNILGQFRFQIDQDSSQLLLSKK